MSAVPPPFTTEDQKTIQMVFKGVAEVMLQCSKTRTPAPLIAMSALQSVVAYAYGRQPLAAVNPETAADMRSALVLALDKGIKMAQEATLKILKAGGPR